MASVKLNHIYKVYENGTNAVSDFNMEIEDKEFIVFVGPSGCGKSTTLRMIAGLEEITAGDLFIDGKLVNELEPKDRDVAMVFQNYALYPHMTVFNNMAFGLHIAKVPKDEIERRVHEAAKILDIEEYLEKKPREMSGGQRQRVALGRAIVRNPKVFLLDEPLSNLDAKLRATMRTEISKLHNKLQTTFIYVTHDQVEAMTMGTRIVVMKKGYVQQIDSPKNLYMYPANKFVAGFIGTPQMNFFKGKITIEKGKAKISLENQNIYIPLDIVEKMDKKYFDEREIVVGIRAEDIHYDSNNDNNDLIINVVPQVVEELGAETLVNSNLANSNCQVTFKVKNTVDVETNKTLKVYVDPTKLHFFDVETETTLLPRVPEKRHFLIKYNKGKCKLLNKTIELPLVFKEAMEEGKEYLFTIPTVSVKLGNTFKGVIKRCEKINKKYLLHIACKDDLVFCLNEEVLEEGQEVSFDIDFTKVIVNEDEKVVVNEIPDYNHIIGRLHRIKALVPVERKGKTIQKKKTGFQFDIAGTYIDVPYEMYDKTLAVLVKKFELHKIEYSFKTSLVASKEEGIEIELKKAMEYGKELHYGVFTIKQNQEEIVLRLPEDYENTDKLYLKLNYEDLKARDTHFDIRLK